MAAKERAAHERLKRLDTTVLPKRIYTPVHAYTRTYCGDGRKRCERADGGTTGLVETPNNTT